MNYKDIRIKMIPRLMKLKRIPLILILLVILIDQWSKHQIVSYFALHKQIIEVNSIFNLVLVYNSGISFGLFNNLQYSNYIFFIISSVILIFLCRWMLKSNSKFEINSLCLIISGAIGNIIDRIIYPGVVDFLQVHWKEYYWPSFNIADSAVCIGVCFLLVSGLYSKQDK